MRLPSKQDIFKISLRTIRHKLHAIFAKTLTFLALGKPTNPTERIIVYTVNIGEYESIKEPLVVDTCVEYYLFTDNPKLTSKHWKVIHLKKTLEDPRRTSRLPKILAHRYLPPHDVSVYLDSSLQIKTPNIQKMLAQCMEGKDIALYKHYARDCVYDEINFVMHSTDRIVADKTLCQNAIKKYKAIDYPRHHGLFENAFIIRRNTEKVRALNTLWWQEYQEGSERDQFTLMYALWQLHIQPNAIKHGNQFRKNRYVKFYKHRYKTFL